MLHTINFSASVNQSTVSGLISNCFNAINQGALELSIHMSSPGGDLVSGFTAYHFLKSLPIPVHTHNLSNIESIANIIFLAGEKRTGTSGCRFLFHPFHWGLIGTSVDHTRVSEWSASLDSDLERYIDILQAQTNGLKDRDEWKKVISTASIANASTGVEWGMISAIEDAKIPLAPGTYWWVIS
ncbi:ATP-dependent Clp protease proteolytic subunit [Pantoea sp. GbtcB22]|uniref:ATP-dependent Clp protease proteolytic subunit n=1 Tax=Pantoea sp. GbtcB22 TaxID=2824767 RepID=UPI001C301FEC|nr:ATP-dependent Clp protease proteolytic subunit [Pantoea sp. GbtcB22]